MIGGEQQAAVLRAHVAVGGVVGGFLVDGERIGTQQLIQALDFYVAGQRVMRLVGAGDVLRLDIGRRLRTIAFGGQAGHEEVEHVVLLAADEIDLVLRTDQHADRTGHRFAARTGRNDRRMRHGGGVVRVVGERIVREADEDCGNQQTRAEHSPRIKIGHVVPSMCLKQAAKLA